MNENASTVLAAFIALSPADRAMVDAARAALRGQLPVLDGPVEPSVPPVGLPPTLAEAAPKFEFDPDFFAGLERKVADPRTVLVYAAGSDGLYALSKLLSGSGRWSKSHPVYKLGVTSCHQISGRLVTLGADEYASYCLDEAGRAVREPGFQIWRATSLPLQGARPGSPVKAGRRGLLVNLPAGYSAQSFERDLAGAFRTRSLGAYAASLEGRERCAEVGLHPGRLTRLTHRKHRNRTIFAEATELLRIAPQIDADSVADVIERLIGDFESARRL